MQHPDEGMIHSWLDGALSAEEATRMESHVATCPSCATAVAEARGFIAASSRILTALDDVPRGVVPAVPARKRDLRVFWRAAAAMLVIAGGSLVVMREGGQDAVVAKSTSIDIVPLAPSVPGPSPDAAETSATSVPTPTDERTSSQPLPAAIQAKPMSTPARAGEGRAGRPVEQDLSEQSDLRRAEEPARVAVGRTGMAAAVAPATSQLQANVVMPEIEATPLKVLKVERTIGSRRTTYEIAPSQTVTLTEPEPVQRSEVRMSAGRAAAQRQATTGSGARAVQPMAAEAASAPPPLAPMMDSRAGTDSTSVRNEASSAAKTSPASPSAAFVAVSNTISWRDPQTGTTLTLSGSLSVERLQEIRKRIERERAAAIKTVP